MRYKCTAISTFIIIPRKIAAKMNIKAPLYQRPSQPIADLIDVKFPPAITLSPNKQHLLFLERPGLPDIEIVSQPSLPLAGLKINPKTNGSDKSYFYTNIQLQLLSDKSNTKIQIKGLPTNPKIDHVGWSPDGQYFSFTHTNSTGISLWLVPLHNLTATQLVASNINDTIATPYKWLSDSQHILYLSTLKERGAPPTEPQTPTGPIVKDNINNTTANRTYQNLLKNEFDSQLFEYYCTAQLHNIHIETKKCSPMASTGLINAYSSSPNGKYLMLKQLKRPFSYSVPQNYFPAQIEIWDINTNTLVKKISETPLLDNIPIAFGSVSPYPRNFGWRADKPDSIYWVQTLDKGDAKNEVPFRDELYVQQAPFTTAAQKMATLKNRFGDVRWGNNNLAIHMSWWWKTRNEQYHAFSPKEKNQQAPQLLFNLNWEDRYKHPGYFMATNNQYGRRIIHFSNDQQHLFLAGEGASPEGKQPFLDKYNIINKTKQRLWQSKAPYYETLVSILDKDAQQLLIRRESNEENPNFFILDLANKSERQITFFKHPYEQLKKVKKEVISYKRQDGIDLHGSLYLPPNYDKSSSELLPVLMWAYPREFKNSNTASQRKDSPYEFPYISYLSPMLWLSKGYAVFQDFSMPIVGEGDKEPNDTFVQQVKWNAEAAVTTLVDIGIANPERIAVGGHSYGAFMTAHLLAHTNLFAAGIARSGAYNRTLTPFGFQSEERSLWDIPDTYIKLSPFMYAKQITTPILLIHGQEDPNSGTYPMQSERFYQALKGNGATARLVMLPNEKHGYLAYQSVMHTAWETERWLDMYLG